MVDCRTTEISEGGIHMDLDDLSKRIAAGERRALARGITLVESSRSDHRSQAAKVLAALPKERQALRIGLSGTPGVGKSTFIESFGLMLTAQGLRVAVLAVDPSSARSGGLFWGTRRVWTGWPGIRMRIFARRPAKPIWAVSHDARVRQWPCARARGLTLS